MDFDHDKSADAANDWFARRTARRLKARKAGKTALECIECGRLFSTASLADPECPRCHGVDLEVV